MPNNLPYYLYEQQPDPPILKDGSGVVIKYSRVSYARNERSSPMDEKIVLQVLAAFEQSDLGQFLRKLKDEVEGGGEEDDFSEPHQQDMGDMGPESQDYSGDYGDYEGMGEPESEFSQAYDEAPESSHLRYSRTATLGRSQEPSLLEMGGPFAEALAAQEAYSQWQQRRFNGDV